MGSISNKEGNEYIHISRESLYFFGEKYFGMYELAKKVDGRQEK